MHVFGDGATCVRTECADVLDLMKELAITGPDRHVATPDLSDNLLPMGNKRLW